MVLDPDIIFFPYFSIGWLFVWSPNSWFGTMVYVKLQYNSLHHRNVFPFFWCHQFCCFFTETLFTIQTTPSIDDLMWTGCECNVLLILEFKWSVSTATTSRMTQIYVSENWLGALHVGRSLSGRDCGGVAQLRQKITQNTPQRVAETRVGEVIS